MKREKKIGVYFCATMLFLLTFAAGGCTAPPPEAAVEEFFALWADRDYGAMYELLDSDSREAYPEDYFTERYSSISEGIGLQGLEIAEVAEKEGGTAPKTFALTVHLKSSTAGLIPLHYDVQLSRAGRGAPWLLRWHPGLILPELRDNFKVDLSFEVPRRGAIYDRSGSLLAGPRLFKEVGAVPGRYEDEESFAAAVERTLGLPRQDIRAKLHQPWVGEGLYVPLKVLTAAEEDLVEELLRIPGVMINEVTRRHYPAGAAAAHLTGYLGEITAAELDREQEPLHAPGDLLGKSGLEAALENRLAGRKGYRLRILGDDGSEVALIAKGELEEGADVKLTIDLELQNYAAEALGEKRGAVVALDPHSGEVLALYSNPGFDPNRFIAGISAAEWQELQNNPGQPFLNRALSGIYSPGSALKPFTAAAAVAEKAIDPAVQVKIVGEKWQPSAAWGDYHVRRVHPEVEHLDLNEAMKFSDNIYFARAGLALGEARFMEYGARFGFGEEIPFPLSTARSRLARQGIGSEIQLADSSYGQGEVLITPLQMALLYSAFAAGGTIPEPLLLLPAAPAPWMEGAVPAAAAEIVHRSLVETLHGARAPAAPGRVPGFTAAGKTGTAEVEGAEGNVCWYVTYGPAESPGIVVAVVVEGGVWASTDALPVGRAVLEYYLNAGGG